jgi:hypothetical protein
MAAIAHTVGIHNTWRAVCLGPDGMVKWEDGFENVVPMGGRTQMVNSALGIIGSTTWYVGLKGAGSPSTADTLASHAGWAEINPYTTDRKTFAGSTATSDTVTNSGSVAAFAITASTSVAGAFLCNQISSSAGVLFGVGDFATARTVASGDTLNVTVSCQITSST